MVWPTSGGTSRYFSISFHPRHRGLNGTKWDTYMKKVFVPSVPDQSTCWTCQQSRKIDYQIWFIRMWSSWMISLRFCMLSDMDREEDGEVYRWYRGLSQLWNLCVSRSSKNMGGLGRPVQHGTHEQMSRWLCIDYEKVMRWQWARTIHAPMTPTSSLMSGYMCDYSRLMGRSFDVIEFPFKHFWYTSEPLPKQDLQIIPLICTKGGQGWPWKAWNLGCWKVWKDMVTGCQGLACLYTKCFWEVCGGHIYILRTLCFLSLS
jgi:hypothetical protein